ncbi:MAG: hypothetical protein SGPRY_011019, partial [Prymnesium sp.]
PRFSKLLESSLGGVVHTLSDAISCQEVTILRMSEREALLERRLLEMETRLSAVEATQLNLTAAALSGEGGGGEAAGGGAMEALSGELMGKLRALESAADMSELLPSLQAEIGRVGEVCAAQAAQTSRLRGEVEELQELVCISPTEIAAEEIEEAESRAGGRAGGEGGGRSSLVSPGRGSPPKAGREEGPGMGRRESMRERRESMREKRESIKWRRDSIKGRREAAGQLVRGAEVKVEKPVSRITMLEAALERFQGVMRDEISRVDEVGAGLAGELRQLKQGGVVQLRHAEQIKQLEGVMGSLANEMKQKQGKQECSSAISTISARCDDIEAKKVDRPELSAVADALRAMRSTLVAGGGGGGGARGELISAMQSGQQALQTQILSLQTHVRALLRKAEGERELAAPVVDSEMLAELKGELNEALLELQGQMNEMYEKKADAEKVELALDQKADRKNVAHKADRSFCEALLSRFSVEVTCKHAHTPHRVAPEAGATVCQLLSTFSQSPRTLLPVIVGRQLGEMERSQQSIQDSLQISLQSLFSNALESAVEATQVPAVQPSPAKEGGGGSNSRRAVSA